MPNARPDTMTHLSEREKLEVVARFRALKAWVLAGGAADPIAQEGFVAFRKAYRGVAGALVDAYPATESGDDGRGWITQVELALREEIESAIWVRDANRELTERRIIAPGDDLH